MNDVLTNTDAADALHEDGGINQAVVEAVAQAKGVSPLDLRPPLYAVVDPDALDELVTSMRRWTDEPEGRVTFPYSGYEVSVTADAEISVSEIESSESGEGEEALEPADEAGTREPPASDESR